MQTDNQQNASNLNKTLNQSKLKKIPLKKSSKKKRFWTQSEDKILEQAVQKYGCKRWSQISKLLKNRHPKRCRQRWFNYLCQKNQAWTQQDLQLLYLAYKNYGNKWSEISKILGRGDNIVKNKITCLKRNGIEQFEIKFNQIKEDEKLINLYSELGRKFINNLIKKQGQKQKKVKLEQKQKSLEQEYKIMENQYITRQGNQQMLNFITVPQCYGVQNMFSQYIPVIFPFFLSWNVQRWENRIIFLERPVV